MLSPSLCYTDSRVVLCWIKGVAREWKPFVCNRIKEIKGLVPSEYWRHCAGEHNPADIPSRGSSIDNLSGSVLWWKGLVELQETAEEIPSDCLDELRVTSQREYGLLANEYSKKGISSIMDYKKYSSFSRLIQVTAHVIKFLEVLRSIVWQENYLF
jgi:hypothetical protein